MNFITYRSVVNNESLQKVINLLFDYGADPGDSLFYL